MGGFLGIGGSSANRDRQDQLQSQDSLKNIFSWALPAGQQELGKGEQKLGQASDYFSKLLTAGRTDTAARIAPAVDSAVAGNDAQKRQASLMGTSRSGGTASHQAEQDSKTNASIDSMISQALQTGKATGAQGLDKIGGQEAMIGTNLFNSATGVQENLLSTSVQSRMNSNQIAAQAGEGIGALFGMLMGGFGG